MEGAARVFAGEFNESTLCLAHPTSGDLATPVTPTGAWCGSILVAGALLEVQDDGRDLVRARVADPTGAFAISAGRAQAGAADAIRKITPPCFVTIIGSARIYSTGTRTIVSVVPDDVEAVDRAVRDRWVLRTADHTIRRIDAIRKVLENPGAAPEAGEYAKVIDHYRMTTAKLLELAGLVETALASIRPVQIPAESSGDEVRTAIMELIKQGSGPRGISVDDLVVKSGERGISSEKTLAVVRTLVEEDECYQPQKGMVKLL